MRQNLRAAALFLAGAFLSAAQAPEVEVAATVAFTEGPAVNSAGHVYFTDTVNSRIMNLSAEGKLTVFRHPSNRANGLVFDARGRLVACEAGDPAAGTPPRVTRTDLASGRIEVLAERYEGKPLVSPNDVTVDASNRIYFTDMGGRSVYRIDAEGGIARILSAPEIERPNGLILSPDDRIFYLIEANQAENGARMIRAYDVRPDGGLANRRVFHNFYPGRSGDGMAIDTQGNLYVAAGLHRRRGSSETLDTRPGVHVFSPAGKLLEFIPIPEDTITNCAFGGADMKTLYVTAGKTLFRTRTKIPGTRR